MNIGRKDWTYLVSVLVGLLWLPRTACAPTRRHHRYHNSDLHGSWIGMIEPVAREVLGSK